MEGVVAQSAVDDVIGVERARHQGCRRGIARIHAVRRQVDGVLERPGDVGDREVVAARILDDRVDLPRRDRCDAVERFAEADEIGGADAVAAGEDAPVVAQNRVVPGAGGDPVVAVAADDRVILAFAEHDVVADLRVDEVVAGFAVDLVGRPDVSVPSAGRPPSVKSGPPGV